MSRLRTTIIALAVAIPVGFLGAVAFNPDNGVVLRSTPLWRIFGVTFELGVPLLFILVVIAGIVGAINGWSRLIHD